MNLDCISLSSKKLFIERVIIMPLVTGTAVAVTVGAIAALAAGLLGGKSVVKRISLKRNKSEMESAAEEMEEENAGEPPAKRARLALTKAEVDVGGEKVYLAAEGNFDTKDLQEGMKAVLTGRIPYEKVINELKSLKGILGDEFKPTEIKKQLEKLKNEAKSVDCSVTEIK